MDNKYSLKVELNFVNKITVNVSTIDSLDNLKCIHQSMLCDFNKRWLSIGKR